MTTKRTGLHPAEQHVPEVVAVNALYTHGLVLIVSTKVRYGGFAKSVGLACLTTPHGLGYAKIIIVVDAMSIRSTSTKSCGPCQCGQIRRAT